MDQITPKQIAEMITEDISVNNGLAVPGVPKDQQPKLYRPQPQEDLLTAVKQAWKTQQSKKPELEVLFNLPELDQVLAKLYASQHYREMPNRIPLKINKPQLQPQPKPIQIKSGQIAINFRDQTILINENTSPLTPPKNTKKCSSPITKIGNRKLNI